MGEKKVIIFNAEWNLGAVTHNARKMLPWWSVVVSKQIKCGEYWERWQMQTVSLGCYKTLVCPQFGYNVQYWLPHLKKDKEAEKIQKNLNNLNKGGQRWGTACIKGAIA